MTVRRSRSRLPGASRRFPALLRRPAEAPTDTLTLAAQWGLLDVVRLLGEFGTVDVGGDALKAAADNGHLDVVRYLLREGGAPSRKSKALEVPRGRDGHLVSEFLRRAITRATGGRSSKAQGSVSFTKGKAPRLFSTFAEFARRRGNGEYEVGAVRAGVPAVLKALGDLGLVAGTVRDVSREPALAVSPNRLFLVRLGGCEWTLLPSFVEHRPMALPPLAAFMKPVCEHLGTAGFVLLESDDQSGVGLLAYEGGSRSLDVWIDGRNADVTVNEGSELGSVSAPALGARAGATLKGIDRAFKALGIDFPCMEEEGGDDVRLTLNVRGVDRKSVKEIGYAVLDEPKRKRLHRLSSASGSGSGSGSTMKLRMKKSGSSVG